jgi:signal transduction histidine kinase
VRRGRLFRKYFLLILALVCGALLISGGIGLYFSYQENKVALASLQHEKALSAAARIEQFVLQIEQQLAYAALPQLGVEGLEQRRIEFLKLLRVVHAVTDITYIDAKGRELLSVSRLKMDEAGTGRDWSQEPAFKNARPGQTWYGPVYFRKETEPYMSLAVRAGGEAGAVTVADVNLKFIWDVVTRIRVGQKGKAYVIDSTGHLVADPDIGLVLRKTDLSGLDQVKAALKPDAEDELAMLAKDHGGNRVLTAFAPIEPARDQPLQGSKPTPLGWKVFVEQPVGEVFQALDATILRTVGLIIAGLLFSALVAMWLARSMARPINVLQAGAQRIGAGDLDTQIQMKTGDELESLADQFNRMTAQLRESYAGLERKVDERTFELKQALEYQAASGEILSSISSSIANTQPVFDAIAANLLRLFGTQFAVVQLLKEGQIHISALHCTPSFRAEFEKVAAQYPRPLTDRTFSGRAMLQRKVMQLAPFQDNPEAPTESAQHARQFGGYDSIITAPMLRGDTVIGAIVTARREPAPFDDKQVALIKAFADQAVIAIENARLVNETKESLEQQTAISEVLRTISDSQSDVKPVLDTVAERAARLCDATSAAIYEVEGAILRRMAFSGPEAVLGADTLPYTPDTLTGRTIAEGKPIHVHDIEEERSRYPVSWEFGQKYGRHSMLAVPLLREGRAFGAMFLRRTEVRPFTEQQITLSKTFADQAAIAIENVRLFNETTEALEQQKASAEVLGTISSSIADTKPVFDKIVESCARLFEGYHVGIALVREDGLAHLAAYTGAQREEFEKTWPVPVSNESAMGRAVLSQQVVHWADVMAEQDVPPYLRRSAEKNRAKSVIVAPMLWEGRGIGGIWVGREFAGPFTEKVIRQLSTFADQAVIAIQNARLFREIQEKSAQLEVANKHKSDFLANMSHELRTPLNAIIGFSEVLIDKMFGELNDKQADYLKDIHESGRHLLSLINDILDLSKIEAGRMDLEVSSFHLPTAISNAMTLVRERAQRHGIQLGVDVDARLGEFDADERKFKQIMLNLLSNAVKFTPDGGRVEVSAKLDTTKVEIAVKDTGIGIAPEDHAAVFEEFKQVGRDYTRKAEGTGLGLALTKRFVELHGGEISLASAPGKGSTFTVTLPLR